MFLRAVTELYFFKGGYLVLGEGHVPFARARAVIERHDDAKPKGEPNEECAREHERDIVGALRVGRDHCEWSGERVHGDDSKDANDVHVEQRHVVDRRDDLCDRVLVRSAREDAYERVVEAV